MKEMEDIGCQVHNNILAFQKGVFSQWYGGYKDQFGGFYVCNSDFYFNCAEQYMMCAKAHIFGDKDSASKILKEKNPKEQQSLGRKIANFNEERWDQVKLKIVCQANLLKFSQNKNLRDLLLLTEGLTIAEAAPWDKIWGVGTDMDDKRTYNKSEWQGQNLLGKSLEAVRDSLIPLYKNLTAKK